MQPSGTAPATKQEIENKYWLEFMQWYADGNAWNHWDGDAHVEYPLDQQFWKWITTVKIADTGKKKGWAEL